MLICTSSVQVLAVQLGNMEAATQLLDVIDGDQTISLDKAGDDGRTIFHHAAILPHTAEDKPIEKLIKTLKKKQYSDIVLKQILDG